MSLFTQPTNTISYDDVVSFCEQGISEGVNLDYKRDFPKSLEKTISAFANTFGGMIIIGVEDEDSKPKRPFVGIKYKQKLEERVWNIILDNIYPPLFPEIRVCPPKKNKTFVIIRVPQSSDTPHAIYNNTDVYIRTGNRNKPEDIATEEKREWLRNRRRKSEELRERLYKRAEEKYQNICKSEKVEAEYGEFTLSFCPLYPQKPLMSVEEIEKILENIRVGDVGRLEFPKTIAGGRLCPIQDGMYYFALVEDTRFFIYSEINKFGLLLYKEDSGWIDKEEHTKSVYAVQVIRRLSFALEAAYKLYNQVGYWGLVEFRFSLHKLLGIRFIPIIKNMWGEAMRPSEVQENSTDDELSWTFTVNVRDLEDLDLRDNKLTELGRDIHWSFCYKIKRNAMEHFFNEVNK